MYRKLSVKSDVSVAASAALQYNLPSEPMSHIILTLMGLNVTNEATLAEVLARLSNVAIKDLGETVFSMSGADLYAFNCVFFGKEPILTNIVATDNATRAITFIIPFGRKLFDPSECYPAKSEGDVKIYIDISATETAIDGLILHVESIILPGASPASFLKCYTKSHTPSATGESAVDLERGNRLAGLLMYATTVPTGTAWTATINDAKIMADNVEHVIAKNYWESIHGDLLRKCGYIGDHGAAYGDDKIVNYGFFDFDPLGDGQHLIETDGLRSFSFTFTAGDTNAIRLIPIEIVGAV